MLKGLDLSTWQAVGTGDGDYDFIICKATEGVGYTDPKCDGHYQRAKSQGKLLGVYHFARPGYNDPISEADWFVHEIQGYIGEAVLVLDWEVEDVGNVSWAKKWLDRVKELTGVKPIIYMSGSVVNSYDWSPVVAGDYGLWIAYWPNEYQYGQGWPTDPDQMTYPIGKWPFWAIWQFSSRNGTLDCDVANMTRDGWMKYAAKNGQAEPAPTPAPAPKPEPAKPSYVTYTVKKGDTLSGIAAQYGTTYQKIAADNGITDPNLIYPGQTLKIYTSGSAPKDNKQYYTVKKGDTLSGIAAKYGTTWQWLAQVNGIANPNLIYPGQVLRVK